MPTARRLAKLLIITTITLLVLTAQPASAAAGDQLWTHSNHSGSVVWDVEANSQYVVSGGNGGLVDARDHSGNNQWTHNRYNIVNGIATGGGYAVAVNDSGGVDVADITDGSRVTAIEPHGSSSVYDAAVDSELVASGSQDNTVHAADPATGDKLWSTSAPPSRVRGVGLSSDYVIAGANGGQLYAFDRTDGSIVWSNTSAMGVGGEIWDVAVENGIIAVAGVGDGGNNAVAVFDLHSGNRKWIKTPHTNKVHSVDVDGRTVVSGGYDDDVVALDETTGKVRFRHSLHSTRIRGVAVSGTLIASGDDNGNVIAAENGPNLQNPTPTNGQYFDQIDLAVDVADTGGDTYTVKFINETNGNGTAIDSHTVSSDQTVSTTWNIDSDEPVRWYAIVEDQKQNERDRTEEYTLNIPATLYIRNETNPSTLVDTKTEVTVRFFGEDGDIIERTTTDGTIDMTGLPRDQPFVVAANPNGDFLSRSIYIQNIFQQQSVYLLNGTQYSSVEVRFKLDDSTGTYDSESFLIVQKAIMRNGNTQWRTVVGDKFGVEGVTEDLHEGKRYRVKVRNQQGDTQIVGPFRADVSETVNVRPGAPTIPLDNYTTTWSYGASADGQKITYAYDDPTQNTDKVTVWIHESGNKSNTLQPNQSFYDVGSVSGTAAFTGSQNESEWVVVFDIDRANGKTHTARKVVGTNPDLTLPGLDSEWRLITAILILFISAGAFSVLNSAIGGVIVSLEAGVLWWTGWLAGATSAVLITFALFISILVHMYTNSGP